MDHLLIIIATSFEEDEVDMDPKSKNFMKIEELFLQQWMGKCLGMKKMRRYMRRFREGDQIW